MTLQWKSSMSGKETRIFSGKVLSGLLKNSLWKNDGYGELNGHMLRFKTRGFWNPVTEILDIEGEKELGTIRYNAIRSRATILYENKSYDCAFDSWTRKKWRVKNAEESVEFTRTSIWKNEGTIETQNISPAIVLAGLFIYGYFWKIAAAS
jgi:hypothetical protein